MATFFAGGIDWHVRIVIASARQIKGVWGVDFLHGPDASAATGDDAPAIGVCDMSYVVCQTQAALHGLAPDAFGELFTGETINAARSALQDSLINDFFPERDPDVEPDPDPKPFDWWREIAAMAGRTGLDPGPLTLRELMWADEGRRRDEWMRASRLEALLININRAKGKAAVKPQVLSPFPLTDAEAKRRRRPKRPRSFAGRLRDMYTVRGKPKQGERLDGKPDSEEA